MYQYETQATYKSGQSKRTSKWTATGAAGEAVGVIEVAHRLAGVNNAQYLLAAVTANAKVITNWIFLFHFLLNFLCQRFHLKKGEIESI